jgi:mevalonate kinase
MPDENAKFNQQKAHQPVVEPTAKEPVSKALNAEIEELLQMLQNSDAKQVLQSMNENQRSLLRSLAK